jgi:hypothetical protein
MALIGALGLMVSVTALSAGCTGMTDSKPAGSSTSGGGGGGGGGGY